MQQWFEKNYTKCETLSVHDFFLSERDVWVIHDYFFMYLKKAEWGTTVMMNKKFLIYKKIIYNYAWVIYNIK